MIKIGERYFDVKIEYKNIKHLYLKIKDAQTLYITCSKRIKNDDIIRFINLKANWILQKVEELETKRANSYLKVDQQIYYWGKAYDFLVLKGQPAVNIKENQIVIYTKNGTVEEALKVLYQKSANVLNVMVKKYEPKYLNVIKDYGYNLEPEYRFKVLKGRWGYCLVNGNRIVLNPRMIHFPEACFEAVLWHELLHFIIPNHSKRFHDILKLHMPSYQTWIDRMY